MLPDSLYDDLPERIGRHAAGHLQAGERLVATCPAKVGWSWVPAPLLPGSCYLALTDRRVIGFLPTKVKALPGDIWFDRPRHALERGARSMRVTVTLDDGTRRHFHLSRRHRQAADNLLAELGTQ
jgi:hypothetical protein